MFNRKSNGGFTLLEILISLGILVVGVVGILSLFPAGLKSSQKAAEETYAAFIADSVYASLRASAEQMAPGDQLVFFHDGIVSTNATFPLPLVNQSIGIPGPTTIATSTYANVVSNSDNNFALLGRGQSDPGTAEAAPNTFNVKVLQKDEDQILGLGQYSYNIEIAYPPQNSQPQLNPRGLFDVVIRIRRGKEIVKKFNAKIFLPTNNNN